MRKTQTASSLTATGFPGNDSFNPDVKDSQQADASDQTLVILDARIASELAIYKTLPQIKDKGDPLEWWRKQASTGNLSLTAMVARKWLAVPASSAASERLFSSAGLTVTD